MNMKHQWILRKATALITALLLIISVLPAASAASPDWEQLQITLSWTDENGDIQSVSAFPVAQTEMEEGIFWAMIPEGAPLGGLLFSAVHPLHEYEIFPAAGSVLDGLTDAGLYIDGISYYPISVYDPETMMSETFLLYVSTMTAMPEPTPEAITEEPVTEEPITS